jgi:hypothetical protein
MKKSHRVILAELCNICNELGATLDGTATHQTKYVDRQFAHKYVYLVLYGVLVDSPDNDQLEYNLEQMEDAMVHLRGLAKKQYPDRKGLHSFTD